MKCPNKVPKGYRKGRIVWERCGRYIKTTCDKCGHPGVSRVDKEKRFTNIFRKYQSVRLC